MKVSPELSPGYCGSLPGDDLTVLWDADTGDALRVCKGHSGEVNSIDLSYKGRFAITGGRVTVE